MLTQQEVREEVAALGGTQVNFLRQSAANDLYFLCKGVLGYQDVNPQTHGGFCRFIQNESKLRRLGLMPRLHLKSTIATIGDSIRLAVQDADNTRILIANEVSDNAQKFLSEIKGHWEKDNLLTQLFPELKPLKFAGPGARWNAYAASLNRGSAHKEDTWTTVGVGGTQVGSHFTRIKCDDLIGFEAAESPAAMAYAIGWVDNIESLLTNMHTDIIDFIGTRWARNDVYAHIIKEYGSRLARFIRQAIENGEVIFPQKHSMEVYEGMIQNRPRVWYAQYANNPLAEGATDFPQGAYKTYWFGHDDKGEKLIFNDRQGFLCSYRLEELDIVQLADPNGGEPNAPDTAASVVTAVGPSPDEFVFVLSSWSDRPSPSGFVDRIYDDAKRWKPRVLGIEKAGQQNTQHYFDKKAKETDFYINVQPVTPRNRNKIERIRKAIEPLLRAGRLYTLATQIKLRSMLDSFPYPEDDVIDELDALAYGPELWRAPLAQKDMEENDKALKVVMAKRRSKRTGY